jgi:hypothetical protein
MFRALSLISNSTYAYLLSGSFNTSTHQILENISLSVLAMIFFGAVLLFSIKNPSILSLSIQSRSYLSPGFISPQTWSAPSTSRMGYVCVFKLRSFLNEV